MISVDDLAAATSGAEIATTEISSTAAPGGAAGGGTRRVSTAIPYVTSAVLRADQHISQWNPRWLAQLQGSIEDVRLKSP